MAGIAELGKEITDLIFCHRFTTAQRPPTETIDVEQLIVSPYSLCFHFFKQMLQIGPQPGGNGNDMFIMTFAAFALNKQRVMDQIDIPDPQVNKLIQPDSGVVEGFNHGQPKLCRI